MSDMTFQEWMYHGMVKGWCSDIVCETHDGVPTTDEEAQMWDDGEDPCIPVIRLWGQNV
jgi:hypothetical protein